MRKISSDQMDAPVAGSITQWPMWAKCCASLRRDSLCFSFSSVFLMSVRSTTLTKHFCPSPGGFCLNVRMERLILPLSEALTRRILSPALKHRVEEDIKDGTEIIGNKGLESPANQLDALYPEQACSGVVRLADRPAAFQEKVAYGGEIEEGGVQLNLSHLGQRFFQILVLLLQFDPLNLEFLNEVLTLILRSRCFCLLFFIFQPLFRAACTSGS